MTSFETLENRFIHKVEEDPDFFEYYKALEDVAERVTHERIMGYLFEAVDFLALQIESSNVDFTDYNEMDECFNFSLTKKEIGLLSSLMFQIYLSRSIAYLKTMEVNWASADLKTFDPSNARSTFMTMYNKIYDENQVLINQYVSRDRKSGALVGIDYTAYSSVDGDT